jgi:glycosyltransferase involved in cell wall biosynthesis
MAHDHPLISVVTPVYNGERYLDECITSVLGQTHTNLDYVIVDNCSKDGTLAIADDHARRDRRVRVHRNDRFVGVIENHNNAFGLVSPNAKYCKVVSADDWIFPECLERLVAVGEACPSAGIVSSYGIHGDTAMRVGLPLGKQLFTGREIARLRLMGIDMLGAPTSVLYRASVVRATQEPFFAGSAPNADQDACLRLLRDWDFGFVHQILCFERKHDESLSTRLGKLNTFVLDDVEFVLRYGPTYLTPGERQARLDVVLEDYYRFLAVAAVNAYGRKFWRYQANRMKELGLGLDRAALARAVLAKLADLALNPKATLEKIMRRTRRHRAAPSQRAQIR